MASTTVLLWGVMSFTLIVGAAQTEYGMAACDEPCQTSYLGASSYCMTDGTCFIPQGTSTSQAVITCTPCNDQQRYVQSIEQHAQYTCAQMKQQAGYSCSSENYLCCQHLYQYIDGSNDYTCSCLDGYTLSGDNASCIGSTR